jgi:hypothetical protein
MLAVYEARKAPRRARERLHRAGDTLDDLERLLGARLLRELGLALLAMSHAAVAVR